MTGTASPTTTDLAVRESGVATHQDAALALHAGQTAWTPMQLAALAQIGIADASDGDKAVFLHVSQRTGLDPFSRQIYMIPRQGKWTIQTGIDGWRVIRARAERRAGVRGTLGRAIFYDPEGNEHKVWVRREPPVACEITYTVRDANGETPYTSVLRFTEYCQYKDGKPISQWASKPAHMLEKCVEADVYRKAFPQDFSGLEMSDATQREDADAAPPDRQRATATQIRQERAAKVKGEVVPDEPKRDYEAESERAQNAVAAQAKRLKLNDEQLRTASAALLRIDQYAEMLDADAAEALSEKLAGFETRAALDALLNDGEVPDGN